MKKTNIKVVKAKKATYVRNLAPKKEELTMHMQANQLARKLKDNGMPWKDALKKAWQELKKNSDK